jgi:hypothetical protein
MVMSWYGKYGCNHVWRYRKDGLSEGCVPAICIECGAFGCMCDAEDIDKDVFFNEGQNSDANINGEWVNPYVK